MDSVINPLLLRQIILGSIALLSGGLPVEAGLVLAPTAVVANDMGAGNQLDRAYNQNHLSHTYTSGVTDFDAYIAQGVTHNSQPGSSRWRSSNGTTTGQIDFDLGGTYRIEQLAMWDAGFLNLEDVRSFTILVSDVSDFATSTSLGTFTLGDPVLPILNNARTHQLFDLTDAAGRYVRFQINSNRGADRTTIAEFAFDAVAVPQASALGQAGLMVIFVWLVACRRGHLRGRLVPPVVLTKRARRADSSIPEQQMCAARCRVPVFEHSRHRRAGARGTPALRSLSTAP